jgi:hypothetical protein
MMPNGAQYVGDFKENNKHGHGEFKQLNGSKYSGNWN